jgi:hypothetical protein
MKHEAFTACPDLSSGNSKRSLSRMSKNLIHTFFLSTVLIGGANAQNTGTLSFFVRDAENGYGTKSQVLITGNDKTQTFETTEGGQLVFNAAEGRYDISIYAADHRPLKTYFTITAGHTLNIEALLDRINKTSVIYEKLDHARIEGFAIDVETGQPLAGVSVAMDGVYQGHTDEKGYFSVVSSEFSEMNSPLDKPVRRSFTFSAPGYAAYTVQDLFLAPTKIKLRVDLKKGKGHNMKKAFQHILDGTPDDTEQYERNVPSESNQKNGPAPDLMACSLPANIRVGTSCSCTNCSNVSVMSLQYYSESGIDDEWIASWQFASLAAGSVPYRSYGGYYVNNPVNANYDIASSTCNQVWGATVYANPQAAAQATAGDALTADGVNPARSEYSAENNYGGTSYNCADCNKGGSGLYGCSADNLCCGYNPAGHGRGMCQWGSQRWALNGQNYSWIINHYYISTVGYSLCSSLNNPPTALSVQQSACPELGVVLNWQNSGSGWFIDITDDPAWNYFWNKDVSNLTSSVCPGSYELYPSQGTYLQFQPNTTYYWRIWDGNTHVYGSSFTTPVCMYSDNNCSGSFVDFGGTSNVYFNNEDWVLTISPVNAQDVTMSFSSFDLEDQYDFLYIYDGNSTAAPLIGTYTGFNSPGTVTSSGPDLTFRFISDPGVQNAGWEAIWSCTQLSTGISENTIGLSLLQNAEGVFTIQSTVPIHASVQVYGVIGNKILQLNKTAFTRTELDLSSNAPGIYFIEVRGEQGSKTFKVIIK